MKKYMTLPSLMVLAGYSDAIPTHDKSERFVKPPVVKECFRKGCNKKRGDRGLYCSAECCTIDS